MCRDKKQKEKAKKKKGITISKMRMQPEGALQI